MKLLLLNLRVPYNSVSHLSVLDQLSELSALLSYFEISCSETWPAFWMYLSAVAFTRPPYRIRRPVEIHKQNIRISLLLMQFSKMVIK